MTARADEEAILRVRAGDKAGFDELVKRHELAIRRLVSRYVKNGEDGEDVTQRAFLSAFEKLDSFRGEATFLTWLSRIAINLALNHTRGEATTQMVPLEDDVAFTTSLGTSFLVASELWRKVDARLSELPPKQRLVLELRLFHGLSFKEVAIVADSSEEAAKANFHHGVKRLRGMLLPPPPDSTR